MQFKFNTKMKKYFKYILIPILFFGCEEDETGTENNDIVICEKNSLESGLVAEYLFESNVFDSGENGLDGEIIGTLNFVSDRKGEDLSALEFSGSGDNYVKINDNGLLDFDYSQLEAQSISVWLYLTKNTDPAHIVLHKGEETSTETNYLFGLTGDNLITWGHQSSSSEDNCGWWSAMTSRPDINEWNHFVVTILPINAEKGIKKIYLNGTLINSCVYVEEQNPTNDYPLYIGLSANFSGTTKHNFDGIIDDLRIYDRELIQDEVTQLFEE